MTVKELKEALEGIDETALVYLEDWNEGYAPPAELARVSVILQDRYWTRNEIMRGVFLTTVNA